MNAGTLFDEIYTVSDVFLTEKSAFHTLLA